MKWRIWFLRTAFILTITCLLCLSLSWKNTRWNDSQINKEVPFRLLAWNCAALTPHNTPEACMSKVLNGGCHVFKRRRGRGKGGKGGKIALVVAVRQATDCSGWLALTPPRRETFKWHSACYNYRLRARERELSNAASMLNLGNTNKSREACRRRQNQNGWTPETRKQPKFHWSLISCQTGHGKLASMSMIDPFNFVMYTVHVC